MTAKPSAPRASNQPRQKSSSAKGGVGFGRPPSAHQFKPGQSGNPKGRPQGSKNESTILRDILHRKIGLREDGRSRKVMVLEAIFLRIAEDSLKGNTKSAAFLLNRYGALVSGELQRTDISDDDREILEAFALRLTAQPPNKGDSP